MHSKMLVENKYFLARTKYVRFEKGGFFLNPSGARCAQVIEKDVPFEAGKRSQPIRPWQNAHVLKRPR